jgi:hypothetical protein
MKINIIFVVPRLTEFFITLVILSSARAADFPQGLVLHFDFDQVERNGYLNDRSGHTSGRTFNARWVPAGKQGGACEFLATNTYILVASAPALNLTQVTFAVWFRISNAVAFNRYILDKRMDNGFALGIAGEADGSKLGFAVSNHFCLSDNPVTDGSWHHGAATFDGKNLKLYVDGKLQNQVVSWQGMIPANTNDLIIGMNRSNPSLQEKGRSFDGMLDNLMIFNHALSEAEIQAVIVSARPKFNKNQVAGRLRMLKELYDRGLLTKDFYDRKVKECEVVP